jgi:hypothetical protein
MRRFNTYACIDWSGAQGARQKGIALAICGSGAEPPQLIDHPGGWSREAILAWLLDQVRNEADLIVGIDFSPALPCPSPTAAPISPDGRKVPTTLPRSDASSMPFAATIPISRSRA